MATTGIMTILIIGEMLITAVTFTIFQILSIVSPNYAYRGSFEVYWNIPTFMCHRYNIPFENATKQFGIIQNFKDQFRGDKLTILYDPGKFPAILEISSTKKYYLRNHGVPQEGNLTDHLQVFEQHVNELIPDPNYTGIAVIDFESWRPVFRQNFGTLKPYKDLSIYIERKKHPSWNQRQLEKEAITRFEIAGRKFMEESLWLAQKLRPEAKWGYYAFPYCFNNNNDNYGDCPLNVKKENNGIQWLFDSSDILFPSVYMTEQIAPENRIRMVRGKVAEAIRVSSQVPEQPKPRILVYHRYVYTDTLNFMTETDTYDILHAIKSSGANGVVLWGSSNDLNSRQKCIEFYDYLLTTLGPVIHSLQPTYSVEGAKLNTDN